MRTNGFQTPFNGMQIATWVLLPTLVLQYLICVTPVLPKVYSIPLTIVYVLTAGVATYYGYVTTKRDSIDFLLHQHLYGTPSPHAPTNTTGGIGASNAVFNEENPSPNLNNEETKYCWVCQTNVHHESMHCKYCDKCVATFDHHCMWLNTCVGTANYGTFFNTVVSTFAFNLIHVVSLALYVALYFTNDADVRRLSRKWFSTDKPIILVGLNIGFLIWTASVTFMVLQLLVFHLGLKRENITTYQYILRDSSRKRDKMILARKVRERRVEELEKAGNSMEAMLLKMGGLACCKACDPVRRLVTQEADQADANEDNESRNSQSMRDNDDDDDLNQSNYNDNDEMASKRNAGGLPGSNRSLGNGDIVGNKETQRSMKTKDTKASESSAGAPMNGMGSIGSVNLCAIENDQGDKSEAQRRKEAKPIFIKVEKQASDDKDGADGEAFEPSPRKRRNTEDATQAVSFDDSCAEVEEEPFLQVHDVHVSSQ